MQRQDVQINSKLSIKALVLPYVEMGQENKNLSHKIREEKEEMLHNGKTH